jgi:hypothetical protein
MAAERETPGGGGGATVAPGADPLREVELARQLTGDLPCPVCRYNLRGLSVKSVCPECGTPVRAAILAAVDPYAAVLQPVSFPRVTAAGIVLWSGAALAAAALTWVLRLCDLGILVFELHCPTRPIARLALAGIVASGVGAIVLIRPHARIPALYSVSAATGVACMFALAVSYSRLHVSFDLVHTRPYLQQLSAELGQRSVLRLWEGAILLVVVLGLRPNVRLLAARSLLMRLGHVDRQTMLAMALALGAAGLGDVLNLIAAGAAQTSLMLTTGSLFLIVIGSMLFTVGLVGVFTDSLRIAAVVLRPPPAPSQVMEPDPPARRAEGRA